MYTRLYRKGQFSNPFENVKSNENEKRSKAKKPRKKAPKKILKYGPSRKTEYSWARDVRLMTKVINALDVDDKEDDDEKENTGKPIEEIAKEEELNKELHVKKIDLKIGENTVAHHTDQYGRTKIRPGEEGVLAPELVVRRGQQFEVTITFNMEYNVEKHDLEFQFYIGEWPSCAGDTLVACLMDEKGSGKPDYSDWSVRIEERSGNDVTVGITPACDCIIGEWNMAIYTYAKSGDGEIIMKYEHPEDITILLNPWCSGDIVYNANDELLKEYVLNEHGAVFVGNYRQIGARPWYFGQFENGILEICLHLMRKAFGGEIRRAMADPVILARQISKIVNNADEDGVLVGNWSGNYEGGKSPTHWVGSVKILRQYDRTNGTPVCFGQCWVFSGVVTTVCRALGMPCRSVTNFASAHDTDGSVTIDKIYEKDKDGDLILNKNLSSDSVWNFHVWNEVWMSRTKDLKVAGYDGWQVIDATPQETSEGVYVCGPSPLAAIKKGEIGVQYDTPFVFAEVNSDRVSYERTPDDKYIKLTVETSSIGKNISTKKPDGLPFTSDMSMFAAFCREDLTDIYKYKEGTNEERLAVLNANTAAKVDRDILEKPEKDVEITLEEQDGIMVGQDFTVSVKLKNICKEKKDRTVSVIHFDVDTKTYKGELVANVKHHSVKDIVLKADKEKTVQMEVKGQEYAHKLIEQAAMEIKVSVIVKETGRSEVKTDDFRLRRPDLNMKVPDKVKKGVPFDLTLSFKNTMPVPLTKCLLDIDGVMEDEDVSVPDVPANTDWNYSTKVTVNRSGRHQISASFDCKEVPDITGCLRIELDP